MVVAVVVGVVWMWAVESLGTASPSLAILKLDSPSSIDQALHDYQSTRRNTFTWCRHRERSTALVALSAQCKLQVLDQQSDRAGFHAIKRAIEPKEHRHRCIDWHSSL